MAQFPLDMYTPPADEMARRRFLAQAFKKSVNRGRWRRFSAGLIGQSTRLESVSTPGKRTNHLPTRATVKLEEIIGSEGRGEDFDNHFWPLKSHNRDRWVSIAVARTGDRQLPPVQLVKTAHGYIVRDGHHRLSVARALGQTSIEAEIM